MGDSEQQRLAGFVKHWSWVYVIYQLAEFDRVSQDEIYEWPVKKLLNRLSFMKDKNEYDFETARIQAENLK